METQDLGIDGLDNIEQIGKGGSSRVFRATQVDLDRVIALKVLKAGDDPNVIRRFDRERKAMGRLSNNEGIVPVYSTGLTAGGEPYLIMPFYERGSLQDRLLRGPVPWEEAVGYIAAAANTMGAAHEAGVVHLDLKPANILLSDDNSPRIADFGIAKLANDPNSPTTTTAAFTPTFSSPEILLGGAATPASDVYGLAATLWSLIAGRPPFRAGEGEDNTLMAVVGRVVHQPVDDLRHLAPDPLCTVIETAMAKDPAHRYPTAGALAAALAAATSGVGPVAAMPLGGQFDRTVAIEDAGAARSGIVFDEAVPPQFVPAEPIGRDRSPVLPFIMAAVAGVGLMILGFLLADSLFGTDSDDASSATTQVLAPDTSLAESTTTTSDAVNAGLGGSTTTPDPASTTTAAETTISTTTEPSTTTSTEPSTTSTEPSTTTTTEPSTTSTSEPSSTTTETTTTTSTSTSTTSPTTTTSSTTTSTTTTTTAARVRPPRSVDAVFLGGTVTVTWEAPLPATGVTGYTIRRDSAVIATITDPAETTFDDEDPVAGATHVYRVRANGTPANSIFVATPEVDIPNRP